MIARRLSDEYGKLGAQLDAASLNDDFNNQGAASDGDPVRSDMQRPGRIAKGLSALDLLNEKVLGPDNSVNVPHNVDGKVTPAQRFKDRGNR